MSENFDHKPERPWPNPYLEVGAIVGHTTDSSCRLWLRTDRTGDFLLLLFRACIDANTAFDALLKQTPLSQADLPAPTGLTELGGGGMAAVSFQITNHDSDTTHVVQLDGLTAFTDYRFALWSKQDQRCLLGHQRPHSFRTLTDQEGPFSFGFFSCHMPYKKTWFKRTKVVNEEMWDYMNGMLGRHKDKELGFIIAGGDQVYADGVDTLNIWACLKKRMRKEGDAVLPTEATMVSWYRDIYRGYWGFPAVREVFSSFPTYMIWDDHEIGDGWGSYRFDPDHTDDSKRDEMDEVLGSPDELSDKGLTYTDAVELKDRMFRAATQVYREYQHSHNPVTDHDGYDYHFSFPNGAVYVLDGRGSRDFNRQSHKVLGVDQLNRLQDWLVGLDPATAPFVFVVSAVPLIHLTDKIVSKAESWGIDKIDLTDDLRDGWEHPEHSIENRQLLKILFQAAERGLKVSVLSGDVHVAAAFRLTDPNTQRQIYQLTSSAITFNLPRLVGWGLGLAVPDDGETRDGYKFKRLARYTDSNYSLIRVYPETGQVDFQLYSENDVVRPEIKDKMTEQVEPVTHSIAKIELRWD